MGFFAMWILFLQNINKYTKQQLLKKGKYETRNFIRNTKN